MPIQFCCTQCGQPIEVDDQHAGQTAACPYCRHTVSVPPQSTYQPETAVPARPAYGPPTITPNLGPLAPSAELRDESLLRRQKAAVSFGTYALICTALGVVLFGIGTVGTLVILMREIGPMPTSGPVSLPMDKLPRLAAQHAWIPATQYGGLFFTVTGLALSIVSLTQSARGNWRGITAVIVCGLFLLCVCSSAAITALSGLGLPTGG
jgi:DNA-directed RNA polymerase subunit RPC12/RpoP